MDYGKLAYMKAVELEERFGASAVKEDGGAFNSYFPRFSFLAGEYPLTELSGSGQVTLIIKLSVRRNVEVIGTLILEAGGMGAGIQEVSGDKGDADYVMIASVFVAGSLPLVISPSAGLDVTLLSVEVASLGGGSKLSGGLKGCSADFCGDKMAAAISKDSNIYVCKISAGGIGEKISAGRGHTLDIIGIDGGFSLIYCDDLNNMWGVRYGGELEELGRRYLGIAEEKVTCSDFDGKLILASLTGGILSIRTCDNDFGGMSDKIQSDVGIKAEEIKFVKHSKVPMIAVSSGGNVYLKIAALEVHANSRYKADSVISWYS